MTLGLNPHRGKLTVLQYGYFMLFDATTTDGQEISVEGELPQSWITHHQISHPFRWNCYSWA